MLSLRIISYALGVALISTSFVLEVSAQSRETREESRRQSDIRTELQRDRDRTTSSSSMQDGEEVSPVAEAVSKDFGQMKVVQRKEVKPWFRFSVDQQQMYNRNVNLSEDGDKDDTFMLISTADLAWAPEFVTMYQRWRPEVGMRYQIYNYLRQEYNDLDFDVVSPYAKVGYLFTDELRGDVGYQVNHYLAADLDRADFLTEYNLYTKLSWFKEIVPNHYFTVSGSTGFYFSDPDEYNRFEHQILMAYTWVPVDNFVVQPFYVFRATHYDFNDGEARNLTDDAIRDINNRFDLNHTVGLSLEYYITNWASVRAYFQWQTQDTNIPELPDYDVYNTGLGANMNFKF